MWSGRFKEQMHTLVQNYSNSLSVDKSFVLQDIVCTKAHVSMLAHEDIISQEEKTQIINGLDQIQKEIEQSTFCWREELEDIHMNIEYRLTELIGEVGQKVHTGRSRNDQVVAAFRLYVSECLKNWSKSLVEFIDRLVHQAEKHQYTILPGYTHMQPAQPVSLAQHLLAYAFMFQRDFERIEDSQKRVRVSPLGAAALAGTTHNLNPQYTAEQIGFPAVFKNSMDAVSDRDFILEGLFLASLIITHLSRLCEEIIIWSNPCFGFVHLPDSFATGSSIMPQKKNPDVAEIMRGKSGRVFGNLVSLLTVLKGLPLTYNRDLQEDKPPFIDADSTVYSSLQVMTHMIEAVTFDTNAMYQAVKQGYLNATELADYLVNKGIAFRKAHHITGQMVAYAEEKGLCLEDLELKELQMFSSDIEMDVYTILDYQNAVERRKTAGGTGFESVRYQLDEIQQWLVEKNKKMAEAYRSRTYR